MVLAELSRSGDIAICSIKLSFAHVSDPGIAAL
jgi:hypothetical protein